MQIPSIFLPSCEDLRYFKEQLDPDRVRGAYLIFLLVKCQEPQETDPPSQTVSKSMWLLVQCGVAQNVPSYLGLWSILLSSPISPSLVSSLPVSIVLDVKPSETELSPYRARGHTLVKASPSHPAPPHSRPAAPAAAGPTAPGRPLPGPRCGGTCASHCLPTLFQSSDPQLVKF